MLTVIATCDVSTAPSSRDLGNPLATSCALDVYGKNASFCSPRPIPAENVNAVRVRKRNAPPSDKLWKLLSGASASVPRSAPGAEANGLSHVNECRPLSKNDPR